MPRFMRTVLLLATLSLLVVPMGNAQAQQVPGEIVGSLQGGQANSCTVNQETMPLQHQRCVGGTFAALEIELEATRPVGVGQTDAMTATCAGPTAAGQVVGFSTRETLAEGRGFIAPSTLRFPTGVVVDPAGPATGTCELRISGTFHRVGTDAFGGLVIDVHVDDTGNPARQFRHVYCVDFEATAIPDPVVTGNTHIVAVVEGRTCNDPRYGKAGDVPGGVGRTAADDADEHGGACVPSPVVICD